MDRLIFISFILSLSWSANATSLNTWEKMIVKIKSYPCKTKFPVYEGSGILLRSGKVITSEHILLPNNLQKVCYRVSNEFIGHKKGILMRNDFSHGLAELNLGEKFKLPKISFNTKLKKSQKILALGFPKGSETLQTLEEGKIRTLKGARAFVPKIKSMLEISNLPVEYGMSGGVLLAQVKGKDQEDIFVYAGALTHQFLQRKAGKQTQTLSINEKTEISDQDLAIGIKSSDVSSWYYTPSMDSDIDWRRQLSKDKKTISSMSYGPISFNKIKLSSNNLVMGGADGVGIGGDDNDGQTEKGQIIAIELRLNKKFLAQNHNVKLDSSILNNWYKWLLRGETLTIIQVAGELNTQSIHSFDQLITLWERDGLRPLVLRGNVSKLDTKLNAVIHQAKKTRAILFGLNKLTNDTQMISWLKTFNRKLLLIEGSIASAHELEDLTNEAAPEFWDILYSEYFDEGVKLETELEKLRELLRKL